MRDVAGAGGGTGKLTAKNGDCIGKLKVDV